MRIYELENLTLEVLDAFVRLIPQLTDHSQPPTPEVLRKMVYSANTHIFIAKYPDQEGPIIGTATLAISWSPTGIHGWIEDVVVDQDYRHKGIGKALTEACIHKARESGLREVNLTSNPGRTAANSLYQSMGFIQRETNVYRYPLD